MVRLSRLPATTKDEGPRTKDLTLATLLSAQGALRARFDDFRRALDRRDEEAYRLGLTDFHDCLRLWTEAEERALLPAILRTAIPGRDPQRELRLEWVQLRELTRYLLSQINDRAPMGDILGFTENLARRFAAHELDLQTIYYPAAASALTAAEWTTLAAAAPKD